MDTCSNGGPSIRLNAAGEDATDDGEGADVTLDSSPRSLVRGASAAIATAGPCCDCNREF
jgi:hypothetical protein